MTEKPLNGTEQQKNTEKAKNEISRQCLIGFVSSLVFLTCVLAAIAMGATFYIKAYFMDFFLIPVIVLLIIAIIGSVVSLVLSIKGLRHAKKDQLKGRRWGRTGIAISIATNVLSVIVAIVVANVVLMVIIVGLALRVGPAIDPGETRDPRATDPTFQTESDPDYNINDDDPMVYYYGNGEKRIELWTSNNYDRNAVKRYFEAYPDYLQEYTYEVKVFMSPDTLDSYLQNDLKAGEYSPDIYVVPDDARFGMFGKYLKGGYAGYAATYKELGIDLDNRLKEADIAPYVVNIGTRPSDGEVIGLSYADSSCLMIYRASIAREVFGTDEPDKIQEIMGGGTGDWTKFFEAAEKLKEAKHPIISDYETLWYPYSSCASSAWVADSKLTVAPERAAYLERLKELAQNHWCNDTQFHTDNWFEDISGKSNRNCFCIFGTAGVVDFVVGRNCGEGIGDGGTYGDWRVCLPPSTGIFSSMGPYYLAYKETEHKEAVAHFISWITLDCSKTGFQYNYANGIFNEFNLGYKTSVASGTVMAISNGSLDVCGGQNVFEMSAKAAKQVPTENYSPYDTMINSYWTKEFKSYINAGMDKNRTIEHFTSAVNNEVKFD